MPDHFFLEEYGKPMCMGAQPGWRLENEYLDGRRRYTLPIWERERYFDGDMERERRVVVGYVEAYTDWSYVDCPRCHAWRRDPEGMRRQEQEAAAQASAQAAAAQARDVAAQARDHGLWKRGAVLLSIGLAIGLAISLDNDLPGWEAVATILVTGAIPVSVLGTLILIFMDDRSPYRKIVFAAIVLATIAFVTGAVLFVNIENGTLEGW